MVHRFGGAWTDEKLERLRKYLCAYSQALKNQPFQRIYIDAFAGTGSRSLASTGDALRLDLPNIEDLAKGSARIALEISPPFDRYYFIEKTAPRYAELTKLAAEYPSLRNRIEFRKSDANEAIAALCNSVQWENSRAVLFLDPYGMQVDWSTVEAIASTKAIDLWYLVPTGMGILRMTPRDGEFPNGWEDRLDRMLGKPDWREVFYKRSRQTDLFGATDTRTFRDADISTVEEYFLERLRGIFPWVAPKGVRLRNRGNTMYTLTFACGNPSRKAIDLAKKLATAVLA